MVKIVLDMNKLQEQLAVGTQHLSQHVVSVAQTAATSIVAGLRTCDERSAGNLTQFEVRVNPDAPCIPYYTQNQKKDTGVTKTYENNLVQSLTVPSTGISVSSGTKKTDPNIADTWGTYSFQFKFALETTGNLAGFLVASARNLDGSVIPLHCRWKRKISNIFIDINGLHGNEYPISADDISSKIIVEAKAVHSKDAHEIAYAELGPFELDSAMRRNLDNYLALGNATFRLLQKPSTSETEQEEFVCTISEHEVKIVKQGLSNGSFTGRWSCKYGADFPWIRILHTDLCSFDLYLSRENKLSLATLTRYQRDLLALTVRCFHGRQWLENSVLLEAVSLNANKSSDTEAAGCSDLDSAVPAATTSKKVIPPINNVDFFVIVHRLMSELHRSLSIAEKSVKERDRAQIEKSVLENDIAATLQAYQKLLVTQAAAAGSNSNPESKADDPKTAENMAIDITERALYLAELEFQLKNSEKQSKKYLSELEKLRKDYFDLKTRSLDEANDPYVKNQLNVYEITSPTDPHLIKDGKNLLLEEQQKKNAVTDKEYQEIVQQKQNAEKEIQELRKTLRGLQVLSENTEPSRAFTAEKTILEKKVSGLQSKIEQLSSQNKKLLVKHDDLISRNKLITESFLYLKSKYDQETSDPDKSLSHIEMTTIGNTAVEIGHETSLLTTALEDAEEKHFFTLIKAHTELDAVKTELEKVITERNRYQKQVQVLTRDLEKAQSQLQTVMGFQKELNNDKAAAEANFQDLQKRLWKQQGECEEFKNMQVTVEELKKDLKEKVTNIEQLQKENELFRSRLRKMAVV